MTTTMAMAAIAPVVIAMEMMIATAHVSVARAPAKAALRNLAVSWSFGCQHDALPVGMVTLRSIRGL